MTNEELIAILRIANVDEALLYFKDGTTLQVPKESDIEADMEIAAERTAKEKKTDADTDKVVPQEPQIRNNYDITTDELAKLIGFSKWYISRLVKQYGIQCHRKGRSIYFDIRDFYQARRKAEEANWSSATFPGRPYIEIANPLKRIIDNM